MYIYIHTKRVYVYVHMCVRVYVYVCVLMKDISSIYNIYASLNKMHFIFDVYEEYCGQDATR